MYELTQEIICRSTPQSGRLGRTQNRLLSPPWQRADVGSNDNCCSSSFIRGVDADWQARILALVGEWTYWRGTYHREFVDDAERCEYFVPIQWIETVPADEAIYEIGLFGNQNSVCKPTTPKWRFTVDRLKQNFLKAT